MFTLLRKAHELLIYLWNGRLMRPPCTSKDAQV